MNLFHGKMAFLLNIFHDYFSSMLAEQFFLYHFYHIMQSITFN